MFPTNLNPRNAIPATPDPLPPKAKPPPPATPPATACAPELSSWNHESEADWLELLQTWLEAYQNPGESTLLYTFVLKTAQAEWHRLRVPKEYDFDLYGHGSPPMGAWQPLEIKTHDLILRYLTAAERRFQREYRLLEHHWKSHHKQKP